MTGNTHLIDPSRAAALRRRAQRGFTLVEIMVVVVIIGLLAALAGPKVWSMLGFGQRSIAQTKCKEYFDQAKTWHMIKKKWPESLEDMESPLDSGGRDNFTEVVDDPWGNKYVLYKEGNSVKVISWGEDGQEGTDDDIMYPEEKR